MIILNLLIYSEIPESHVAHLVDKSETEINRLISMVVDVDNMYIKMTNEENPLTKTVFHYLFRVRCEFH